MAAITARIKNHKTVTAIIAVVIAALIAAGAWLWVRADHGNALADCRDSATTATAARKRLQATLADGVKLAADAKQPGEINDQNLLKTVEQDNTRITKDTKTGKDTPADTTCPADATTKTLRGTADANKALAGKYDDAQAVQHQKALRDDMDKTTRKRLQDDLQKAQQLLKDTDGKVADNATRDQLQKAIDGADNTLKQSEGTAAKK